MAKHFLVITGDEPVKRPNLVVVVASKRYGHGDPIITSDRVAECDLVRRFLKEKFIKKISEKEYKALIAVPSKKTPAKKKAAVKAPVEKAEVKEPEAPKVEIEEAPEPEPTAPKVEEKPKRSRRGSRKKKNEDK